MKKIFLQAVIYSAFAFACAILPLSASAQSYSFNSDFDVNSSGPDVVALQSFLVSKGFLTMPAGVAMGYFGGLTRSAVAAYQASKGITPARGYFGPITRSYASADSATLGSISGVAICAPGVMFNTATGAPCVNRNTTTTTTATVINTSSNTATAQTSLGQIVTGLNVSITPKEVVSDSRCPQGVTCIWAGTVEVRTALATGASYSEQIFKIGTPVRFGNFDITLTTVTPSPKSGERIDGSSYRFTYDIRAIVSTDSSVTTPTTATLTATVGGKTSTTSEVIIHPGELVTYAWSSTNADQASSVYTSNCSGNKTSTDGNLEAAVFIYKADCGSGNWYASTINGTYTATNTAPISYNYILTYTVKNTLTGQTATAVLKVYTGLDTSKLSNMPCDPYTDPCPVPQRLVLDSKRTLIESEYKCILNRAGDESGITHFTEVPAGVHFIDILATFFHSAEWLSKNATNEAYVYKLYKCVLNRVIPPTPTEMSNWVSLLNSGSSRDGVLAAFIITPEYKSGMGAILSSKFGW